MIPTEAQAKALWSAYHLPEAKRVHVSLVGLVAVFLAQKVQSKMPDIHINIHLLYVTALLHDIDKAVPRMPGETHPDTGVRLLRQEGMDEVADIVVTHPLHSILDERITPKSWEEKLLYLADKMVKFEIITVDKRFALWQAEGLPSKAQEILTQTYPKVKALEREVFDLIGMKPEDVAAAIEGEKCLQNYEHPGNA